MERHGGGLEKKHRLADETGTDRNKIDITKQRGPGNAHDPRKSCPKRERHGKTACCTSCCRRTSGSFMEKIAKQGLTSLSPEILAQIMHNMDTDALLKMARTCRLFSVIVQVEWRTRVYERVGRHVRDVAQFFALLDSVSALIAGSAALAVVTGINTESNDTHWTHKGDLDVYVPNETAAETVKNYLRENDGYEGVGMPSVDEERYWEEPACVTSVTRFRSAKFASHIDIVCAQEDTATLPIVAFWGTLVMNFITSTRIIVMYPRWTLEGKGMANPRAHIDRVYNNEVKYEERGFVFLAFPHNADGCFDPYNYCPSVLRYTEDAQCLSIAWNETPSHSPIKPHAPSFDHVQFSTPPSFWRWRSCPASNITAPAGYSVGRL